MNKNLHDKLKNIKSTKPKEYWNLLNPKKRNKNNAIDITSLYNHFKILNEDPNNVDSSFDINEISLEGDEALNNDFTATEINNLINVLSMYTYVSRICQVCQVCCTQSTGYRLGRAWVALVGAGG